MDQIDCLVADVYKLNIFISMNKQFESIKSFWRQTLNFIYKARLLPFTILTNYKWLPNTHFSSITGISTRCEHPIRNKRSIENIDSFHELNNRRDAGCSVCGIITNDMRVNTSFQMLVLMDVPPAVCGLYGYTFCLQWCCFNGLWINRCSH